MNTTTQKGVADNAALNFNEEDAADAFLSRWSEEDPEKVSDTSDSDDTTEELDEADEVEEADEGQDEAEETDEDPQDSDESDDDDEETEEESEEEEPKKGKTLDDEAKVKIKVDDEELEVSVKDLKRLYGQEAALTKKSQQVAAQRKEVEAANTRAAAQLQRIHEKALARWEPYSKIDMLVASKQLDADQFAALRAEAQAAYDDYRFITTEVDDFVKNANAERQKAIQEQAKESVKVLQQAIPKWSPALYDELRAYVVEQGLNAEIVNQIVDPAAIQIWHKAMQFDKAKAIVTTKKVNTPKKVLKTTKPVTTKDNKVDKTKVAKQSLARSGSTDDAANLFLARWAAE
jgi:hypothetical protein